jgi:hypothetical protein
MRMMDFLSPAEHQQLLEHALACQADFKESGIVGRQGEDTLNYDVRRSRTLSGPRLDEIWNIFDRRLHGILPGVRKELGMAWFHLGDDVLEEVNLDRLRGWACRTRTQT